MTEADIAWLTREIEHCRRMEYVAEAQRFERILAAIADRSPQGRDKGTLGSVHESGGAGTAIAPPKGAA